MSHLCDSTVAGPTEWKDIVLASKCEYPPFRHSLLWTLSSTLLTSTFVFSSGGFLFGVFELEWSPKAFSSKRGLFATLKGPRKEGGVRVFIENPGGRVSQEK